MFKPSRQQIVALASLFGRRARIESEFPKQIQGSRRFKKLNKDQECARRLRQAPWGISPLRDYPAAWRPEAKNG